MRKMLLAVALAVVASRCAAQLALARAVPLENEARQMSEQVEAPPSEGEAGAGGGEPLLCRDGRGAEEGAHTPIGRESAARRGTSVGTTCATLTAATSRCGVWPSRSFRS